MSKQQVSTIQPFANSFDQQTMWRGRRRKKLQSDPFPSDWMRIIETHCPFYHQLAETDRKELAGHVNVFMAEKKFEGCGGLNLTNEIKVCIAAHACLLLLHRQTDYYPGLQTILVYPSIYVVPTTRHVGGGVLEESRQPRAGESWREGAVVLTWDVICNNIVTPENGYNVVLHEFAHQLDYEDGRADGVPLLGHNESWLARKRRYAAWTRVMQAEYEQLRKQAQLGENTVLRGYGAINPAEFFAVATECYFGKPKEMQQRHPELYQEMSWYYQQDPAHWPSGKRQPV